VNEGVPVRPVGMASGYSYLEDSGTESCACDRSDTKVRDTFDIQANLARFHNDVMYFEKHYDELLERYSDQWVAVFNERVVGVDDDLERLIDRLREEDVPPERAYIDRPTHEDYVLIV
jgi:hypothetical protein